MTISGRKKLRGIEAELGDRERVQLRKYRLYVAAGNGGMILIAIVGMRLLYRFPQWTMLLFFALLFVCLWFTVVYSARCNDILFKEHRASDH